MYLTDKGASTSDSKEKIQTESGAHQSAIAKVLLSSLETDDDDVGKIPCHMVQRL